jgi:hypothetical protein
VSDFTDLDPWGAEVFSSDPYLNDPQFSGGRGESGPTYSGYGDISKPSNGCMLDGGYTLCDFLRGSESLAFQITLGGKSKQFPLAPGLLGIFAAWVEDAGKKLTKPQTPNGAEVEEGDTIVTNTDSDGLGHWELINLALPQKPPTIKNATSEQQSRFNEAYTEFWKRLHADDGKNPCADLFGGVKNAEKALKSINFSFGRIDDRGSAETSGKNVTIDPNGQFMDNSGSVKVQIGFNLRNKEGYYINLNNVEAAAFVLAHEAAHRSGKLQSDGNDPFNFLTVINNGKVHEACFSEVPSTVGPLPPGFR